MKFLRFDKSQVITIEAKEFLSMLWLFRKNLILLTLPLKNKFNQIFNCVWLVAWKPFVLWIFRGQSNGTPFLRDCLLLKQGFQAAKRTKIILSSSIFSTSSLTMCRSDDTPFTADKILALNNSFEADNSQIFHRPLEDYYRKIRPAKCIHQLKNRGKLLKTLKGICP